VRGHPTSGCCGPTRASRRSNAVNDRLGYRVVEDLIELKKRLV